MADAAIDREMTRAWPRFCAALSDVSDSAFAFAPAPPQARAPSACPDQPSVAPQSLEHAAGLVLGGTQMTQISQMPQMKNHEPRTTHSAASV